MSPEAVTGIACHRWRQPSFSLTILAVVPPREICRWRGGHWPAAGTASFTVNTQQFINALVKFPRGCSTVICWCGVDSHPGKVTQARGNRWAYLLKSVVAVAAVTLRPGQKTEQEVAGFTKLSVHAAGVYRLRFCTTVRLPTRAPSAPLLAALRSFENDT